jgi:DNA-binding transcriptional regulator YiaG
MTRAEFNAQQAKDLKRQRESLGMTQEAVGDAIGVSASTVAIWEQGRGMSAFSAMLLVLLWKRKWSERGQEVAREAATSKTEAAA